MSHGHRLRQQATYDSTDRETEREFFSPDKVVRQSGFNEEQMRIALKACVGYNTPNNFPSAEEFVCEYLGVNLSDPALGGSFGPLSEDGPGKDNVNFMRVAFNLSSEIEDQISTGLAESVSERCSYCGQGVDTYLGLLPVLSESNGSLVPSEGPVLIHLDIECDCNFVLSDYEYFENKAIQEMESHDPPDILPVE